MALDCRILTEFAELESISSDWDRLVEDGGPHIRGAPFQSWGWASACWAERQPNVQLHTPVATESGRVVAIMPLVLEERTIRWLGSPYADYNDIVCKNPNHDILAACYESLLLSSHWTIGVLENVADSSAILSVSDKLPLKLQRRLIPVPRFAYSSVREDGSGVLEKMSRKRSFRQHENQLRRAGRSLEFRHIVDRSEMRSHLNNFFAMHISRNALAGRRSLFLSQSAQSFFSRLVETMSPASDLRFAVLELDGRAIAYHFGYQKVGQLICYVPTFHADYWDLSPGDVLFRNLFKYAHESGFDEFDFTIGDESYKSRFANVKGQSYTLYFERNLASPKAIACRALRSAERQIRQRAALLAGARQMQVTGRRVRDTLTNLGNKTRRQLHTSVRASRFQVSLATHSWESDAVFVEKIGLHSLGLYLAGKKVRVSSSQFQEFRDHFKKKLELYRVVTLTWEFLFWRSEHLLWEDALTLATPTRDFGRAVAALLAQTVSQTACLTTRRRNAIHSLLTAGLNVGDPALRVQSSEIRQSAVAI